MKKTLIAKLNSRSPRLTKMPGWRCLSMMVAIVLLQGCGGNGNAGATGSTSSASSAASSTSSSSSSSASSSSTSSSSSSGIVHATCGSSQHNAFQMYAPTIPSTIEAEDFDPNGYSDSTAENEGGAYRTDTSVDIKPISGGHALGWMTSGEYLEYSIYVENAGEYAVTIRSGSQEYGRTLKITQCNNTLLESFEVPKVETWGQFKTWSAGTVYLTPGYQKIRVEVSGSDYLDLDWIHIGPYAGNIDPPNASCDLPSTFQWQSTPAIIGPQRSNWASVKDPSIVRYNGKYHIWATVYDLNASWASAYISFDDWANAGNSQQVPMAGTTVGNTVAPQVFYFEPQNQWYLITQWGGAYATSNDPTNVNSWSRKQKLLQGEPQGALDFWVICNDTHCYLYFSRDDGVLYMSKTTVDNFPNFSGYSIVMEDHRGNGNSFLFEAANVYKVDGQQKYLLLVEAYRTPGYGPRYFRSWTATSLDGPWTALADTEENPFAGNANVTFPQGKWSDGISHGEMIRSGINQKMTIDPCNLEYLYQGDTGESLNGEYGGEPYKLGLLRLIR